MRRIAALYDIHGNLPALRAVLADVHNQGVDHVVIGGDVASGPLPAQTLEALTALKTDVSYVMGNGDREIADAYDGEELAAAVLFCHGSPRRDTDMITTMSDDRRLEEILSDADAHCARRDAGQRLRRRRRDARGEPDQPNGRRRGRAAVRARRHELRGRQRRRR